MQSHGASVALGHSKLRYLTATGLLLAAALGLSGCYGVDYPGESIADQNITYHEYDDNVDYDAPEGDDLADAPLEVHDFDPAEAEAGGASQVINGNDWLDADDFERNEMLLKIEKDLPPGATVVLVVSTGEVWVVPEEKFAGLEDVILPWWEREYDDLDRYYGEHYGAAPPVTLAEYTRFTALGDESESYKVVFLHDLNPAGVTDSLSNESTRVMRFPVWNFETPQERSVQLRTIARYLDQTPPFHGLGKGAEFGVTFPEGTVYAIPALTLDSLIQRGDLKTWAKWEISRIPDVPMTPLHPGRSDMHFMPTVDLKF